MKVRKILLFCFLSIQMQAMELAPKDDRTFVRQTELRLYETLGVIETSAVPGCTLFISGAPNARMNGVICLNNTAQIVANLKAVMAFFRNRRIPFSWSIEESEGEMNVLSILSKEGPASKTVRQGLLIVLNDMKSPHIEDTEFTIDEVKGDAEFHNWREVLALTIDDRSARTYTSLFQSPSEDHNFIHVIGKKDGKAVSIGSLLSTSEGGYISNLATRSEWSRRGYGAALVGKLLTIARNKKLSRVALLANQEDAELFAPMGFREVCCMSTYE